MGDILTTISENIALIASAFLSVLGVLASISVARISAKSEVDKILLMQKHEEQAEADKQYSKVVYDVILYTSGTVISPYEALAAIGALRVTASGDLGKALDALYHAIPSRNLPEINEALENLIETRRESGSHCKRKSCLFRR